MHEKGLLRNLFLVHKYQQCLASHLVCDNVFFFNVIKISIIFIIISFIIIMFIMQLTKNWSLRFGLGRGRNWQEKK